MANWIRAATVDDFNAHSSREVVVGGRVLALFRVGDQFFALDGICPHQGGPLGKGQLQGCVITCPWHGWQFDVRTGQHEVNQSIRHTTFPVKVDAGVVYVDVNG